MNRTPIWLWLVLAAAYAAPPARDARAVTPSTAWSRQIGTTQDDESFAVSADGLGSVYLSGYTTGSLGGMNAGGEDAFVAKYDAAGTQLWSRQLGTAANDRSYGVSADKLGNVFVVGSTLGNLGGTNAGSSDAFVTKYNAAGNLVWTRQFGNDFGEIGRAAAVDRQGGVYVTGYLGIPRGDGVSRLGAIAAYVRKYSSVGTVVWERLLDTPHNEYGLGLTVDNAGNVYVGGETGGSLGGPLVSVSDAFVSKFDAAGNPLWTRQLGSFDTESVRGVSIDGTGNVYFGGNTYGSSFGGSAGGSDAFIGSYNSDGILQWIDQFGTRYYESGNAVAADAAGNVFIAGGTQGRFDSTGPSLTSTDVFVAKHDVNGTQVWKQKFASINPDEAYGISFDGMGNLYIAGTAGGGLAGERLGEDDAFLMKFSILPEPAAAQLLLLTAMLATGWRRPR